MSDRLKTEVWRQIGAIEFYDQPTPDPSQEGKRSARARAQFPSWEGSGVGSFAPLLHSK